MRVLVVQHDHASPLGPVAEQFVKRGYEPSFHLVVPEASFHSPGVEGKFPDFRDFDAVVLMGAPWSEYDEGISSWVIPERVRLREADAAAVPVLGICFGGQILASALGGEVVPAVVPEIGWTDVASEDETLVPDGPWFQWHYDSWKMPPGATQIASNAAASQAFVLRRNLALQFHPELTSSQLAGWLNNGGAKKASAAGLDPDALIAQTESCEVEAHERTRRLVDGFIDRIAAPSQRTTGVA